MLFHIHIQAYQVLAVSWELWFFFMGVCTHMSASASAAQRGAWDHLDLEFKAIVSLLIWVLGIRLGPLEEQQALDPSAISPASKCLEHNR